MSGCRKRNTWSMTPRVCNNCGKQGHLFYQCQLPMTSYGLMVFRDNRYLMIRRKHSFGFIDFVRGKYNPRDVDQVQRIINEMSLSEKQQLVEGTFDTLWTSLWGHADNPHYKQEEGMSRKKMQQVCDVQPLAHWVSHSTTAWEETEWEFPKGRRNPNETDLSCAVREFEEETGLSRSHLHFVTNVAPLEEKFTGTNCKEYCNKYFVACMEVCEDEDMTAFQPNEVSQMAWKTWEECMHCIREYHHEKRRLLSNLQAIMEQTHVW